MNLDLKIDQINQGIWQLWHDNAREAGPRVPKFIKMPEKPVPLVFLSLNPSFPTRPRKQLLEKVKGIGFNYPKDFNWKGSRLEHEFDRECANQYAKVHHCVRDVYPPFFGRLNCISDKLQIGHFDYGHIDLFLLAHASFKCLHSDYHDPRNWTKLEPPNDFVQRQLDIAYELIHLYKPKLIVAVYIDAAKIFLTYHASAPKVDSGKYSLLKQKMIQQIDLKFQWGEIPLLVCSNLPGRFRSKEKTGKMIQKIVETYKKQCCKP
jgi:hypothetical protein